MTWGEILLIIVLALLSVIGTLVMFSWKRDKADKKAFAGDIKGMMGEFKGQFSEMNNSLVDIMLSNKEHNIKIEGLEKSNKAIFKKIDKHGEDIGKIKGKLKID